MKIEKNKFQSGRKPIWFITSSDPSDTAAEALHHDRTELAAPIVVLVPDIGKRGMLVAFAVYKSRPFLGICCNDQKGVAPAELKLFVCDGVHHTAVLLFDLFHFGVKFGLLISPIAAEAFKEADHAVLPKSLYVGFIDVHAFHEFDRFVFLFCDVKCHFLFSFSLIF